ncbi:hypothetical protein [Nocardioides sp. SYSU DS0663]|uniref:hypothetical protein n=1 Tax=Nocardioides sp. SYSU DS0663 TaxID=3416445 RepID=UPI003F4B1171
MQPVKRRGLRGAGMACAVLATSVAVALPSMAEGGDEPHDTAVAAPVDLVGAPEKYLIENVHAAGKVMEIGNPNAMLTGPGEPQAPAAAAIFSRAVKPAALAAQVIEAYPVVGATDTYVLTNAEGDVLARRDNGDQSFRYLEVVEQTPDEAAADPYAQWRVADAGNGSVYLQNVQPYDGGAVPNLDMYNWATADGSEIQTYDAGSANVQKWVLRSLVPSTPVPTSIVDPGTVPTPPSTLKAKYSWGAVHTLDDIAWAMPDESVWDADGTEVTIEGTGLGYFGEDVAVSARYTIGTLGDAVEATMTAYVGATVDELRVKAPRTVERTLSGSEQTVTSEVSWDWSTVTQDELATAGSFTVPARESVGFDATLRITLAEQEEVNLLRAGGVHLVTRHADSSGGLTDGNRNAVGFSDWRGGGETNRVDPNLLTFHFDVPSQVTGVGVYDIGGKQNIGGVTVQYRDTWGGWYDLPAHDQQWPYANSTPDLALDVDNDPVLATGVRVRITHKSNATWKTLSEVEVYGRTLAGAR